MSEGIIIALITAIGSLLGGIIGQIITASATVKAAEIKEKANSPSSGQNRSLGKVITGAIIGAVATLIILFLFGMIQRKPENPTFTTPVTTSANVLSDSFEGATKSYDTNIWSCLNDCNIENIFLQDGFLILRRTSEGVSDLLSNTAWDYDKIRTLSGKMKISKSLYQGEDSWSWISLDFFTTCNLSVSKSPNFNCAVGSDVKGDLKYQTNEIPVNFDTWYSVKIDFDHNTNTVKFYLDKDQIGQYVLTETPKTVEVSVGIYSLGSGQTYVDDVLLTLAK